MKYVLALTGAVLALTLTTTAAAVEIKPAPVATPPSLAKILITRFDQNGDGKIGEDEFFVPRMKGYEEIFKSLDRNNNGLLETSELKFIPRSERPDTNATILACIKQSIPAYAILDDSLSATLTGADTNADGKLSFAEVSKAVQTIAHKIFTSVDTSADGLVTETELGKYLDQTAKTGQVIAICVIKARIPAIFRK